MQLNSFITASSVTSIRPLRDILIGRDGIFYMHLNSLIMSIRQKRFFMKSPRGAVIGKFCSYLAFNSRGWSSLRVVFSQTRHFTAIAFTDAYMYTTSITQRSVLKAAVPDRMVWLPKPACVIVAVHLSNKCKALQRPCCPLLKLLLIKNFIILTPCTSTQRKLENEQRKSYRILISSCWTTDIRSFDFYRKRGLGPD